MIEEAEFATFLQSSTILSASSRTLFPLTNGLRLIAKSYFFVSVNSRVAEFFFDSDELVVLCHAVSAAH